jgi:hypothetical protein
MEEVGPERQKDIPSGPKKRIFISTCKDFSGIPSKVKGRYNEHKLFTRGKLCNY